MTDPQPAPEKRLHVVIGTPDPDGCPICRAHASGPGTKTISDDTGLEILVQELPLGDMLRCPCPLCAEARRELHEG
jgi:hypothetical protein